MTDSDIQTMRLSKIAHLLGYKDFFREGYQAMRKKTSLPRKEEDFFALLQHLVSKPELGWVSVAFFGDKPVGFAAAMDATPPFSPQKEWIDRGVYAKPGVRGVARALQYAWEAWAKSQGIAKYYITTTRKSGAAARCFIKDYKFRRAFVAFEKDIE